MTIMLEASDGKMPDERETRLASADNAVILANMPSVHDVANYILHKKGRMSTWKLQKLVYYSQAWSLVWDDGEPLFGEPIEAWANGPVVSELYKVHRGDFAIEKWPKGDWAKLSAAQRETIDAVLKYYGKHTGHWLSELTHREDPWRKARRGYEPRERGNREITLASMSEYYSSL
jgi:uncharacterized phage-associated protein